MAQHLVNRKGYYSIEQSYRDEYGRVRKRYLRYLGRFSIDWRTMFASECLGVDWDAIERQELARMKAEEEAHTRLIEKQQDKFWLETGLHLPKGPVDPVPIEKAPSSVSYNAPAPSELSAPADSQSEEASAPIADATDTATPS